MWGASDICHYALWNVQASENSGHMLLSNVYGVQTLVNRCVKLGGLRPVRPYYPSGCFKAIQRSFFRNRDLGPYFGWGKSSHYREETEKGETTDWEGHPQFQQQKVEPTAKELKNLRVQKGTSLERLWLNPTLTLKGGCWLPGHSVAVWAQRIVKDLCSGGSNR